MSLLKLKKVFHERNPLGSAGLQTTFAECDELTDRNHARTSPGSIEPTEGGTMKTTNLWLAISGVSCAISTKRSREALTGNPVPKQLLRLKTQQGEHGYQTVTDGNPIADVGLQTAEIDWLKVEAVRENVAVTSKAANHFSTLRKAGGVA